ncbi:hypothetical protein PIB30_046649 [Stylosanthes scabra]|uniref:Uncharacterized protein n=1 Tax=Stylosanthes scabra TaxID=79078 RepID=A0ABU6YF41_9FABA|nr:hypothetical protein [Stylosanthes scabra]
MRLTDDRAAEGDFMLEAAGPSDRLPFRAQEDRTNFLWVYTELFTCLGVRLPFIDFQREVLSQCRVAASQLHLNGWGFFTPLSGKGFMSFRAYQDRKLFDSLKSPFKSSNDITSRFCLFLSLPTGLGKKSNFKCRWILDHSDTDVGVFLDSLLKDMEKQSRFHRLMQKMKDAEGAGPRSIIPSSKAQSAASGALASDPVAPASTPAASVPPVPPSGAVKSRKKPPVASSGKPFSVEGDEGVKEDPSADLRQKKTEAEDYNFWVALDTGLTNGPIREILGPLVSEQLLGTTQYLACKLTACLQICTFYVLPLLL